MVTYGEWDWKNPQKQNPGPATTWMGRGSAAGGENSGYNTLPGASVPGTTTQVPQKRPPGQTPPIINLPPNPILEVGTPPGGTGFYETNHPNEWMLKPGGGWLPRPPGPGSGITYGEHNYPGGSGYKQGVSGGLLSPGDPGGGGQAPPATWQDGVGPVPPAPWVSPPSTTPGGGPAMSPTGGGSRPPTQGSGITYGEWDWQNPQKGNYQPGGQEPLPPRPDPKPNPPQYPLRPVIGQDPPPGGWGPGGGNSAPLPPNPILTSGGTENGGGGAWNPGTMTQVPQPSPNTTWGGPAPVATGNQYNQISVPYTQGTPVERPPEATPTFANDWERQAYDLRMKARAQTPKLNPYDVGFGNSDPTAMEAYFKGRQSGWGIPQASSIADYLKFRLPGLSSGGVRWR